ncbi:hypothetical protein QYE76_068449 [Lolium multiflorum]|uniref:Transposase (putative) gypsy type domain-containing protein n=1 Tax=Lolium multiflorum TaxID=4521 RepID=A0AAD8WDZ2_LOLMU|nr:hypothetical protein QYE76_068449 [Lolium multiflorum]
MAAEDLEWERSKISNQDLNMMKKLGLMKKEDAIRFPSEESYPNPPMEYRGGAARAWAAPSYGVTASSTLLRRLFAYLKPLHRKPLQRKPRYAKPSRAAAIAKPRSGGQRLHERDIFDLFLPEFDKPWVIHLRETCCSTNLCSWRPNTVYKNRSTVGINHLIRGLSAPIHDFLRGLLFVYGIQLHQLTPNSILHISIFITLCECFLGVPPNWALWKRIFLLRRNASRNAAYNIGGVVICVRTDVEYFDVKFPDSVQGWRKKWLYIHEESANSVEHNIIPFDGNAKIQRRRSWDAEASEEEKKATEALMSRIRQLQNTRGKELSGVQITAYFLRIRVQPLQARKNPLWTYAGGNDANRLSSDLSAKDLEKLIRRISRLNKKDPVPSSVAWNHTAPPILSPRTILLWLLFLPFLRMEKSKNKLSLPKTIKVLLFMKVKSQPMIKDLIRIGSQFIGYREYANKAEEKLAEANNRADTLVQKLEQSEAARKKAELVASEAKAEADEAKAKVASVEELQKRLEDAESALNEHKTAQAAREEGILKRLKSQIRRTETQTNQGFDLENPVNDPLLDTLSYLELHGSEIREGVSNANAGLSTLFPYFFPKKEEPPTFLALAKSFNSSEDLGLKMRQENMKVAVESTVALVADSQQTVDWMKVGDTDQIEQSRWRSLIKAAKPNTKKILAYLGIKPSSTPSSSRPEV